MSRGKRRNSWQSIGVAGVDEAKIGALAGPFVTAAVYSLLVCLDARVGESFSSQLQVQSAAISHWARN